jgi:hypothetical protein
MDKSLSEQQEQLLFMACKSNGGVLPVKMATDLYSSKSAAKSALNKLRLFDYISLKTPGYFEVDKLPRGVKQELKELQDNSSEDKQDDKDFVSEPVN